MAWQITTADVAAMSEELCQDLLSELLSRRKTSMPQWFN